MIERMQMKIAWLMPDWLVYWCAIRLGAYATQGKYATQIVPELRFMDAIERWRIGRRNKRSPIT